MKKAKDTFELLNSVKNGRFTLDGSGLEMGAGRPLMIQDSGLTTLTGSPKVIHGMVNASHNNLTNLRNIHQIFTEITGNLGCLDLRNNPIESHILGVLKIKGLNYVLMDNVEVGKIVNRYLPSGDILDCQEELIEAGYSEYAQL